MTLAGTEIGVAYVSVVASTDKIAGQVKQAFDGPVATAAASSGPSIGSKLASGIGTTLKAGALTVGTAAGAALGSALALGLGRLTAIDDAQGKLKGLGHSASEVSSIMSDALSSVKGTAFGLGDAATVAATAVAAGIAPGQDLRRTLGLVADSATIAGSSMSDMGAIFNSVAAQGKLMGGDLMQLQERGIPVVKFLSETMHESMADVVADVSKGKVSFEQFQVAMEHGLGGAALKAGDTVTGSFKNMEAAIGRFGAALLAPGFSQAPAVLSRITSGIDGMTSSVKAEMPLAIDYFREFGDKAREMATKAASAFQALKSNSIVTDDLSRLQSVFETLASSAEAAWPAIKQIGTALATASAQLGVSAWQLFLNVLESGAGIVSALVGPLNTVASLMSSHQGIVTAAAGAWLAFKTIPSLLGNLRTGMASVNTEGAKTEGVMQNVGAAFGRVQSTATSMASGLSTARSGVSSLTDTWKTHNAYLQQANPGMSTASANLRTLGSAASAAAQGGMSALGRGVSGIVDAFGGPWGIALAGATVAIGKFSGDLQNAQVGMRAIQDIATTSSDSVLTLAKAFSEVGSAGAPSQLDAVTTAVEAMRKSLDDVAATAPGMFDFTQSWGVEDARSQVKDMTDALTDLGLNAQTIGPHMLESKGAFDQYVASLRDMGDQGNLAADAIEFMRATVDQAKNMDFNSEKITQGLSAISQKAGDAGHDLQSLSSVIDALTGNQVTAFQAASKMAEQTKSVSDAAQQGAYTVDAYGQALLNANGGLDVNSAGARKLGGDMITLGENLKNVAASHGDWNQAVQQSDQQLQAMAAATGLPIEKIRELAATMGVLPRQIQIAMSVDGLGQTISDLGTVAERFSVLPTGKTIRVDLPGGVDSAVTLQKLGFTVSSIPGSKEVSVTAQTATARSGLEKILTTMGQLNLTEAQAKVFLNTASFTASKADADGMIAQLNGAQASPKIIADITSFLSDGQLTQQELSTLDTTTASPQVKAIIDDFIANKTKVEADIKAMTGLEAKPTATLDPNPVLGSAKTIQGAIDAIHGTSVTVTVNEVQGTTVPHGNWRGGVAGRWAGGITPKIPGYASGFRLPLSGPGTDIRDGFLGLGANGMPTVRVDAGEWVINNKDSSLFDDALAAINSGNPSAAIAALMRHVPARSGSASTSLGQASASLQTSDTYNIYTVDVDAAIRSADRTQQRKCARYGG